MTQHRWTPADRAYIRNAARNDADARDVASHFGISVSAVQQQAWKLGVRLRKKPREIRVELAPNDAWTQRALAASRAELRLSPELQREIAAIRAEWTSAPRFKIRAW